MTTGKGVKDSVQFLFEFSFNFLSSFFRYMKQQDLFRVVIGELEQEKSDDSAQVKNDRFKRVLENMQKVDFSFFFIGTDNSEHFISVARIWSTAS